MKHREIGDHNIKWEEVTPATQLLKRGHDCESQDWTEAGEANELIQPRAEHLGIGERIPKPRKFDGAAFQEARRIVDDGPERRSLQYTRAFQFSFSICQGIARF